LYPDVYVGRLPCRNTLEVKIMVNKIINYEKNKADQSWFNKIVLVGGDSHDDRPYGYNYYEGELVCDKVMEYMTDFDPTKLYASNRDTGNGSTPTPKNITNAISEGCGFLLFDGHGNPASWNTHWPDVFNWKDTPGGIKIYDFPKLRNGKKLPVTLVGGCHNSMFNVSLLATVLDIPFMWTYGQPTPECWSWWLTRKIGGGSIATFGSTGLGYGYVGGPQDLNGDGIAEPACLEGLGGYMEILFFKTYSEGTHILGDVWGQTVSDYLDVFPGMDNKIDCKQVQEWAFFGDPTLLIGGY
ncbi:MAG: hypothetical protein DRN05_06235, partial [Thermoplasmata archaeon]